MQEFGHPQYGHGIGGLQRLVGPSGEALAVGEAGWRGAEIDGGVEGEGKGGGGEVRVSSQKIDKKTR